MASFTKKLLPALSRSVQLLRLTAVQQQRCFHGSRLAVTAPSLLHNIQVRIMIDDQTRNRLISGS